MKLIGLVDKKKKRKEKGITKSSKSNPKNFWKYVNSKPKASIGELHIQKDSFIFVADADKAEVLSDFFSSVFTREPNGDI